MNDQHDPSSHAVNAAALFAGDRLTLARHLAGLRKVELATKIQKSGTAVTSWETGLKRPTPATVAQLALTLGVDPGFFAVRPHDLVASSAPPHFRSLRSTTQLARDQAFSYGQLAVDIAATLERHVEFPAQEIPVCPVALDAKVGDEPEAAARFVRKEWGLGDGPIKHVVRLLELHGILVVFSPPQAASVDAYSFESQLRSIVVLNPLKQDYYRQRFDVAHELGHLVMHSDAEPGGRVVEDQAHRFASEFLAPANAIEGELPLAMSNTAWAKLGRLKEQWGLSIQALLYRSRRLGRLSDVSYRNAMITISKRGWRRDEPGLISTVERPSLLPRSIELLEGSGISEMELVRQAGVPVNLFRAVSSPAPIMQSIPAGPPRDGSKQSQMNSKVISLFDWRDERSTQ